MDQVTNFLQLQSSITANTKKKHENTYDSAHENLQVPYGRMRFCKCYTCASHFPNGAHTAERPYFAAVAVESRRWCRDDVEGEPCMHTRTCGYSYPW